MVERPAWHLVKALDTLVSDDGNKIAIVNDPNSRPLSLEEKALIDKVSKGLSEAQAKKLFSVKRWINDLPWEQANERLESQPTVNIEGLVGGYTGPGGKTILPHRAVAKIDMRLVPDMKAADALAALKAHLAKRGFGDIEVKMTGGYDPTSTSADSALIKAQVASYKKFGIDPMLWPRNAGSYPGYVFTGEPSNFPPVTSGSVTAAARTRPTNTTSSNRPTRKSKASMARPCPSSNTSTSWRNSATPRSTLLCRFRSKDVGRRQCFALRIS